MRIIPGYILAFAILAGISFVALQEAGHAADVRQERIEIKLQPELAASTIIDPAGLQRSSLLI